MLLGGLGLARFGLLAVFFGLLYYLFLVLGLDLGYCEQPFMHIIRLLGGDDSCSLLLCVSISCSRTPCPSGTAVADLFFMCSDGSAPCPSSAAVSEG